MDPQVCISFDQYFEMGLTASKAREHHVDMLQLRPDFDEGVTLADASINPKMRVITNLYEIWRKKTQGGREGSSMLKVLREKIVELEGQGTHIALSEAPFALAVVPPISQRVHQQAKSCHIAFVDSTSSCDLKSHSMTFILSPSAAGALPLGYIITEGQGEAAYTNGFGLLKGLIGPEGFGHQGYPTVFMTDESDAERAALKKVSVCMQIQY